MSRRTPTIGRIACGHAPGGFALVAVLWVTAILAAIATGYATMARLQGQEALHGLTAAKQTYLLQSALAKGEHELRKYTLNRHLLARKDELESIGQKTLGLWWPRHEAYRIRLEDMNMAVRLVGDTGKLDVNSLDYARWVTLLAACGLEDSAEITAVANSIVDWTDEDTNFSIGGAENDYYQGLDKPYLCKDGPMESIEELLLVKGVTPELYHGTDERPGLSDLLDVGGSQDKLDINSASPRSFRPPAPLASTQEGIPKSPAWRKACRCITGRCLTNAEGLTGVGFTIVTSMDCVHSDRLNDLDGKQSSHTSALVLAGAPPGVMIRGRRRPDR